jgi:hypothetical protein
MSLLDDEDKILGDAYSRILLNGFKESVEWNKIVYADESVREEMIRTGNYKEGQVACDYIWDNTINVINSINLYMLMIKNNEPKWIRL